MKYRGSKFVLLVIKPCPPPTGALSRTLLCQYHGVPTAKLSGISQDIQTRTPPRIIGRRLHPMSELSDKAKEMVMENGMAFLLGWILGMGLGQQLWDSITGVL